MDPHQEKHSVFLSRLLVCICSGICSGFGHGGLFYDTLSCFFISWSPDTMSSRETAQPLAWGPPTHRCSACLHRLTGYGIHHCFARSMMGHEVKVPLLENFYADYYTTASIALVSCLAMCVVVRFLGRRGGLLLFMILTALASLLQLGLLNREWAGEVGCVQGGGLADPQRHWKGLGKTPAATLKSTAGRSCFREDRASVRASVEPASEGPGPPLLPLPQPGLCHDSVRVLVAGSSLMGQTASVYDKEEQRIVSF